jgi:hypothetical protein
MLFKYNGITGYNISLAISVNRLTSEINKIALVIPLNIFMLTKSNNSYCKQKAPQMRGCIICNNLSSERVKE